MAARSVHRSHYILRFELFTFLVNSFKSKFHFFFRFCLQLFCILEHSKSNCETETAKWRKTSNFEFQFRLQFFRSKICILHTRCVILFVIIANSRLVSNYDLLCKNRVSNWKRSHFESERFNWIEQTWFVSLFYVNRNFANFYPSIKCEHVFYT